MAENVKACPHCGYENKSSALMCGLCGTVFASAQQTMQTTRTGQVRKDFAAEIRDNRIDSVLLLIVLPMLIVFMGFIFGAAFGFGLLGIPLAAVIAVSMALASYYSGDSMILGMSDAKPADPEKHQQLINVVDEMRIAAGLPMPKVYVIETGAANAFATGRDPEHATVCVTTGLLELVNREELQGVVAHEMSHVRNLDIRFMMLVAALVGAVVLLADGMKYGRFGWGFGRRRGSGGNGVFAIVGILLILLAPLFAVLVQMAASRRRELLADASGVELTRNPLALASALEKIDKHAETEQLPGANRATQHMYIVNPLKNFGMSAKALMSTHPPMEARIRILRAMA